MDGRRRYVYGVHTHTDTGPPRHRSPRLPADRLTRWSQLHPRISDALTLVMLLAAFVLLAALGAVR